MKAKRVAAAAPAMKAMKAKRVAAAAPAMKAMKAMKRELECHLFAGQLLVDSRVGFGLVFNVGLLVLIQMNLEQTGTVKTETNPFADNFCRVNKVVEDSIVDSHQSTTAWTLLLLPVHFPGWFGQNSPLGNEDHMLTRELLLQFANQPGLDLLKGLDLWNGHEDNNGLFALANLDFLSSSNVQFPKVTLEVRVHLEV